VKLPQGYRFAATYAGIRKRPEPDLALMVSDVEATAAGLFTQNVVRAAPVILSAQHLVKSGGRCRGIIVNAGNANCATSSMAKAARASTQAVARLLGTSSSRILVASTGVIGEPLDERKITAALPSMVERLSPEHFPACARAIMTTDTIPKTAFGELATGQGAIRTAGMAKGAGMIHPRMATMLGFLFTDAAVPAPLLQRMLRSAAGRTFNRISVDSDTSTNDTLFLLANGRSGVSLGPKTLQAFDETLRQVAEELAIAIARDGEGARKLLTIEVEGAASDRSAEQLARAIANSPLVKTALAGADPNWGRFLSAAGASGVKFDPSKVDLCLNGHLICHRGLRAEFSEPEVQKTMLGDESKLLFQIRGKGAGKARFWTCDLTADYIRINADYRT
jgi:glutamate N-acetyltransferase/amino-acid N-acetyltransferase